MSSVPKYNSAAANSHGDHVGHLVRVLIAEDEPLVRSALSNFIDGEGSLSLVGAAADAVEAIDLATTLRPDVAIIDVKMPGGGGPVAAREIRARSPHTRVVALSGFEDLHSVEEMLRAGATSYLVKGTPGVDLVDAIHNAARGHGSLSVQVAGDLLREVAAQLRQQEIEAQVQRSRLERIKGLLLQRSIPMVFQPITELRTSRLVGLEALARFDGTTARTPETWLAEAEEVGLRMDLELAAVKAALPALSRLPETAFLAVNVSPETAVASRLLSALSSTPLDRIVIEITEHAPVIDYGGLNDGLEELRRRGVRLAIDDAGAGFASLRHIVRMAPEFIKLDISLTRGIDLDPACRALTTALISFASEIGATIIAEGIETEAELETLRSLGVSWGQGYHIAVPGPFPGPSPNAATAGDGELDGTPS